jgi:SHAQKYF class myb-like DNA-binding protein
VVHEPASADEHPYVAPDRSGQSPLWMTTTGGPAGEPVLRSGHTTGAGGIPWSAAAHDHAAMARSRIHSLDLPQRSAGMQPQPSQLHAPASQDAHLLYSAETPATKEDLSTFRPRGGRSGTTPTARGSTRRTSKSKPSVGFPTGSPDVHMEPPPLESYQRGRIPTSRSNPKLSDAAAEQAVSPIFSPSDADPPIIAGPKKRFLWTDDLHRRFVAAVFDFGLQTITPKALFEMVKEDGPPGMTSDNIKSHLQKFRNNSRESRERFLRDFATAREHADLRAAAIFAKTKEIPFPVQFSTYPVSMPLSKQGDLPDYMSIEEISAGDPHCPRCKELEELMDLGVGIVEKSHHVEAPQPRTDVMQASAQDNSTAEVLAGLSDVVSTDARGMLERDEAVELAVQLLTAPSDSAIQQARTKLSKSAAMPLNIGIGEQEDVAGPVAALRNKLQAFERLMQTQMRMHRAILSRQDNQIYDIGGADPLVVEPSTDASVPLPKSLKNEAVRRSHKQPRNSSTGSDQPLPDQKLAMAAMLKDIFSIDDSDDSSVSTDENAAGIPRAGNAATRSLTTVDPFAGDVLAFLRVGT